MTARCDIEVEKKHKFISGVIEGFYGRPWTTEQRKDLFRKLKKWGMESYVYAPKDDYKHRAYWRELYTVEEADHLSSLIASAKEQDIIFYYALSPGLDMTYSSQKELLTLKRKLDQVSQFGCEAFALLFDDIESELSKADKEAFQTFANAQVSVTNEIFAHLGNPKFLFCPTQYCASRALPAVHDSEYLNTLGSKLNNNIDILWTGNKVISKNITLESIQEVTDVLRRSPVIWDNLHANDYDQKRVFLGPYSGRSPELIPHLRGVMTNPNCEFHANTIAIHTLAYWSKCSFDAKVNSSISADIKLETENEDDLLIEYNLSKNIYHPRLALKNAITEWLPEFDIAKEAWGPITKPQPQVTMVLPIIPIIPSINTCMSLTTTTSTSTNSVNLTVPEVNTTQLQAFAEVCKTVSSSTLNPISNPVMNSLVLPTKVVTNDDIINPIPSNIASNIEIPKKIPISIVSVPIMHAKSVTDIAEISENEIKSPLYESLPISFSDENGIEVDSVTEVKPLSQIVDSAIISAHTKEELESEYVSFGEKLAEETTDGDSLIGDNINMLQEPSLSPLSTSGNEPMECSSSLASQTPPKEELKTNDDIIMAEPTIANESINAGNSMQVESCVSSLVSNPGDKKNLDNINKVSKITIEDLYLLCDLFYLPFENGSRGLKLLQEFNWLKANAGVLIDGNGKCNTFKKTPELTTEPEVLEWIERAEGFSSLCNSVQDLMQKIATCANKEICHDLYSYVWEIACALTLLNAFVKWLSLGKFPQNVYTFTQGSYTWFSKGWKEAFMSGDQEPWVFRGGLIADLQRLLPVDSGNDLFIYKLPELPTCDYHIIRPYLSSDEAEINNICTKFYIKMSEPDCEDLVLPERLLFLIADYIIGALITLFPEFCIVAQDNNLKIIGFVAAALDVNIFVQKVEVCWIPAMCEKYERSLLDKDTCLTPSGKLNDIFTEIIGEFHSYSYNCPAEVYSSYPAVLNISVLAESCDNGIIKRLLTVCLAALRSNGCFGAHVRLRKKYTEQIQFYHKLGFVDVYTDTLEQHVYLGRRF